MPWWVIPEGFVGKLVNALGPGATLNLYTVKQSATEPAGAVGGPYATQAEAQAQATAFNTSGKNQATLPNIATGTAQAAATGAGNLLGLPSVNGAALRPLMVRVMKVIAGLLLVAVGVVQLAHPEKALAAARGVIA
jgi:hypothetical protein